jgi:hypothetical protein
MNGPPYPVMPQLMPQPFYNPMVMMMPPTPLNQPGPNFLSLDDDNTT